jgi:hypothetical protein
LSFCTVRIALHASPTFYQSIHVSPAFIGRSGRFYVLPKTHLNSLITRLNRAIA